MLGQLFDIEADDGPGIGGAQMADEKAQLVEVGDHAAPASLLQAEQNLSLHLRRQSVQRDLMTVEDRRSSPTPRLEIDIKSFAALIPPPCISGHRTLKPADLNHREHASGIERSAVLPGRWLVRGRVSSRGRLEMGCACRLSATESMDEAAALHRIAVMGTCTGPTWGSVPTGIGG